MANLPHATDFTDLPKKQPYQGCVECPRCKGHGYWNLQLNAYGPGKHFQMGCSQCNGHGCVVAGSKDETCVPHEYKELSQQECRQRNITHHGMCWHVDECTKCGKIASYDSSG